MTNRFILHGLIFFFLFSGAFAAQFEVFGAAPMSIADAFEKTPPSQGLGLGIGFTSMDKEDSFGVMMNAIVYYQLHIDDSIPLPEGMSPVGLDILLGATVLLPITAKNFTFPITLAFHTRAAFLDGITQFDFGANATVGATFWVKQNYGFFARSLFSLDFSRVNLEHENSSFEKNLGFVPTAKLSTFSITPEIGFTIRMGKTPEVKQ